MSFDTGEQFIKEGQHVLCCPVLMDYLYDQFGRKIYTKDIAAVERLIALKKKGGSSPWPVIEQCIKIWEDKRPKEWKSFLFEVDRVRGSRANKFAVSKKDKVHGGYLRYILDIPDLVIFLIRRVYSVTELPMTKDFLYEFARRFPHMRVAEKL